MNIKIVFLSGLFVFLTNCVFAQKDDINVNVTTQNTTANRVGAFNSARMAEWRNMRARRLQKYLYDPSKETAQKLYHANKVIGLPWDADIKPEHVKLWLPKIDLSNKVTNEKPLSRDEAVKQLKEAKELLDSGILTQEEYNKLSDKLKPIIVGK